MIGRPPIEPDARGDPKQEELSGEAELAALARELYAQTRLEDAAENALLEAEIRAGRLGRQRPAGPMVGPTDILFFDSLIS